MPVLPKGKNMVKFEGGAEVELHFHDYDEPWFIVSGRGSAILVEKGERREHPIGPGDIVVTYAGDEHGLKVEEPLTLVYVPGTMPAGARQGHLHMPEDAPAKRLVLSA